MQYNSAAKISNMDLYTPSYKVENGKYIRPPKEKIKIDPKEAQAITTRLYEEAKKMKAK